jgi:hypothetical protein
MVKLRCIRHADILKRAYLCQVSDTGSPEPLVMANFDRVNRPIDMRVWKGRRFENILRVTEHNFGS